MAQLRSLEEAEVHVTSLTVRVEELERRLGDHDKRFNTLQTPLWKRLLFRLDGWPGQCNLNADRRRSRPWHC